MIKSQSEEQPTFGSTIVKYDEETHSHQRKVVLSGFPYDEGTRRNGGRIGGSVGPKFFRQALASVELYAKHSMLVVDAGDIEEDLELETAHKHL
jgi:arginase family enzyme